MSTNKNSELYTDKALRLATALYDAMIALIDQLTNEALTDDELKEAQERKPNDLR